MPPKSAFMGRPHISDDPQDISVQLNVKVPWHYREQLVRMAREQKVSLNRFVVNALVRSYPPERQ